MTTSLTVVTAVDWGRIVSRLQDVKRRMVHEENWSGPDFEGTALRRALGYQAAGETGRLGRALPYDHISGGFGLLTDAEAKHTLDGVTYFDRIGREDAEKKVKEMRAEVARVYREASTDLAKFLRHKCNERSVPSRYRREGVAWAANMIDPSVPKDQYGNLRGDGA